MGTGAVLGALLLTVFSAAWVWWDTEGAWTPVPALGAEPDDELELVVFVGCIDGEMRASVAEQADRLIVMVEIRGRRSENDCMRTTAATLPGPRAGRGLVDWSTGEPIPIG